VAAVVAGGRLLGLITASDLARATNGQPLGAVA
jgi:CBS domain-containing protein